MSIFAQEVSCKIDGKYADSSRVLVTGRRPFLLRRSPVKLEGRSPVKLKENSKYAGSSYVLVEAG